MKLEINHHYKFTITINEHVIEYQVEYTGTANNAMRYVLDNYPNATSVVLVAVITEDQRKLRVG